MHATQPPAGFRRDINGLRAWAVLAVILFHFGIPGFSGGFVGVDIFFVISGFLMSGMIIRALEDGRFSLVAFYLARARRIIPALAVLCAALLAGGWFFLQAPDYSKLAAHAVYSLGFLSNTEYLQETGYFNSASHEKWLLHTWSLSVEWQFYLVLPLALAAVWRLRPGRAAQLAALAVAAAASLAWCVHLTAARPAAAFFLLAPRAWEMLAGGLVFLAGERLALPARARQWLHGAGLALLVLALALFDRSSAWPGFQAGLPVLAACLVLLARQASAWTGHRVAQWVGDRSYSLYLWHWPVYVALVFAELRASAAATCAALALVLVLGHLSYIAVEQGAKAWLRARLALPAAAVLAVLVALAAAPALLAWRNQGWPGRFPESVERAAREAANSNPRRRACHTLAGTRPAGCHYGAGSGRAIVLGDSHADAVVTGVASALGELGIRVEQMSYSGCPFVAGLKSSRKVLAQQPRDYQCAHFIEAVGLALDAVPASVPVIIVNHYAQAAFGVEEASGASSGPRVFFSKEYAAPAPAYLAEFSRAIVATACGLARHRPVYLVRPIPEMGASVPKALSRRLGMGIPGEFSTSLAHYREQNDWVWKGQDAARATCGVEILDPTRYLCRDGRCYGSINGRPLYYDDNHLSEYGNKLLVPMVREAFRRKRS